MSHTPHMLLISTPSDHSLDLFGKPKARSFIQSHFMTYDTLSISELKKLGTYYEYVYLRDPFNDPSISLKMARQAVESILTCFDTSYIIDKITSFEDLLFEDKWAQYRHLSAYMPHTELLTNANIGRIEKQLIKKRISSRAKGIIFTQHDLPKNARLSDYIIQQRLAIDIEYRVFLIGGKIIQPLIIRSSKTPAQKVKALGIEHHIPREVVSLCSMVYSTTGYDFMGLDIAKMDGSYYLLEVNRSCQFGAYLRESSLNLASIFNEYLLAVRPVA